MQAPVVRKLEKNIDRAASALFAGACAYAAYMWFATYLVQPALGAETGGVAAFAYLCCSRVLNAVSPRARRLPVPVFDLRDYEPGEPDELLLTERYQAPPRPAEEPLVLDDILAELGPDSRVVRLFDPAAMPTPAQLKSRIDRHLDRQQGDERSADAARALHEALAELRRSIR